MANMAGKTLTHEQVAALAESVGLPGEAFAQIARGESGYQVGAVGHDPGGTQGLGLWQITTKYNDDIIAKYGGRQKLLTDPVANAKAAKAIYDRQGIKAWYGTKYLTNPAAHYTGPVRYTPPATSSQPGPTTAGAPAAGPASPAPVFDPRAAAANFLAQGGVRSQNALQGLLAARVAGNSQPMAAPVMAAYGQPRTQPRAPQPSASPSTGGSGKGGSEVLELIYNDGGKGYGIKNGQVVDAPSTYKDVWAGHADHVHVAAGPKTVVRLGKLAQSMGLQVGENPHFGGVDPVHVPGSYHYKGEAIDVSGTPEQRAAFARAVERYNRTRRL